jgi:hypothetical protein
VPATDTENPTLISDDCTAELRDVERVVENYLLGVLSVDVPEVDLFRAPFKIMNVLVVAVAFLEDESVVEQLPELVNNVHI